MQNGLIRTKPNVLNVLIVDDEETVRNMIKEILLETGEYNVWTAKSGEEAMEIAKKIDLNIVVTDIRMPGIDGVEVTRKFKQLNSDTSVIVITGYASIDSAIQVLKEGAYDYITKPFNIEEMKIVVSRAAERQVLMQEAKEKHIYQQLAILDSLTEIYNRRYLDVILPLEVERAHRYKRPLSVLMIDVDYFKSFNDHNNHIAGDWALKRIAQLLAGNIRKIDFAFRYGGEEFMLALPETNKEKAIIVAKRLKEMIGNTKFLDKNILPTAHLTISLGIATLDEDVSTAQELITAADNCLYLSKELGRDRICILKENGERTEVT